MLGVIVTLIVTHILRNSGKIKMFLVHQKVKLEKEVVSNIGDTRYDEVDKSEAKYCNIEVVLEIYNGSEVSKIFRDIKICFYRNKELQYSITPDDKATKVSGQYWTTYDEALNINVPAKQISVLELRKYIRFEDSIDKLKNSDSIYIEMRNHNSKKYRLKIAAI